MSATQRNDYLPLTPLQQGILLEEAAAEDSQGAFVLQLVADCGPGLDVERLRAACARLLVRYPNLRACFRQRANGDWVQVIPPSVELPWEQVELGEDQLGERLEAMTEADRRRPFDLGRSPALRATLCRLPDGGHRFLLAMHHVVIDGWSIRLLVQELVTGYLNGDAPAEEDRTFRSFLAWHGRADRAAAQAAWASELADRGEPTLLSAVAPRATEASSQVRSLDTTVSGEAFAHTQAWLRQHGLTLNDVVQGAWALVVGQLTGRSDVVFGMVDSGRSAPVRGIETAVGLMANTVPVRVRIDPRASFLEHVRRVHEGQVRLLDHRHLGLSDVQQAAGGGRLFDTLITSLGYFDSTESTVDAAEMGLRAVDVRTGTDYPVTLTVVPGTSLGLRLQYRPDVVAAEVATHVLDQIARLVASCAQHERELVSRIEMTTPAQRTLVLTHSHGPSALGRGERIADRIAASLLSRPDHTALICGDEQIAAAELARRINALARLLIGEGIGPEQLVAIACPRLPALVTSIGAVLTAGGAYLPVDANLPALRLTDLLGDAPPRLLLGLRADLDRIRAAVPGLDVVTIALDDPGVLARLAAERSEPVRTSELLAPPEPDHPAYLIFTSGSTGRPKAVVVTNRGLVNIALDYVERVGLAAGDRLLAVTTFGFDIAMLELLGPLVGGATLVLADGPTTKDPHALGELLASSQATHLQATPVHWRALEAVAGERLAGLKVVTGGEALSRSLAERLHELGVHTLFNLYGPTETTIWSTGTVVEPGWSGAPSIGVPMAGNVALVLDDALRPVPTGVPGELYLAGDGVARGYHARPGLTTTRFVANPFGAPGSRMYRTGDLARWDADGTIDFLGRVDHQIKIHGLRIEVGEIESVLGECPGVSQSVVVANRSSDGADATLAGFVETDGSIPGPETVTAFLAERLPAHMIPSVIRLLERMPLTASGKVDRNALPAVERDHRAAGSELEQQVLEAFGEVLGRAIDSIDDDFFALGGHSLLASILVGRLRRLLGVELGVRALFDHPTPASLAGFIGTQRGTDSPARPEVRPLGLFEGPLSAAQQRMWMLSKVMDGGVYNEEMTARLVGPLDVEALREALGDLAERHLILRTVYPVRNHAPVQVVRRRGRPHLPLEVIDVADPEQVEPLIQQQMQRDFDLESQTPTRGVLFRLSGREHVLLAVMNHIAIDGWSDSLLARDLATAYAARLAGREPHWPQQDFTYLDYTVWQRELLGDAGDPASLAAREGAYWSRTLADLPAELELPWDRPRPAIASGRGGSVPLELSADLHAAVSSFAAAHSVTPFTVLHAALAATLSRLGAGSDIPVGTALAGRTDDALLEVVGMFINTVVLRTDVSADPTFEQLVARAKETNLGAMEHQNLPFETVVDLVGAPRSAALNPLFQVALVLQNAPPAQLSLTGIEVLPYAPASATAKLDLAMELTEQWSPQGDPAGLTGILEYNADLLDQSTVVLVGERFARLLAAAVTAPETRISALPLLSHAERADLIAVAASTDWGTGIPAADGPTLADRFASHAGLDPHHPAVVWDGPEGPSSISFDELRERANQLARALVAKGCGPGDVVGHLVPRSADAVVAVIGILASGAAYLPLDPSNPPDRNAFALNDAGASVVVTTRQVLPSLAQEKHRSALVLDDPATTAHLRGLAAHPLTDTDRSRRLRPDHPAYLIYTSGSTGRPKGVVVSHRSALELAVSHSRRFGVDASTRVFQFASFGFDAAYWELAVSVLSGATAVIAPEDARVGPALASAMRRHRVTLTVLPPAALGSVPAHEALPADLTLLVAGEACPPDLVARFGADSPMINAYGPTETTVCASVSDPLEPVGAPPIGRAVAGHRLYVLGERLEPVAHGVAGELYVGGSALALGYHGRTGLTASRFVADPFSGGGQRMYRTGDVVRWRPDDQLDFIGRADDQVKLHGHRIELGEVEAALVGQPGVAQAVAIVREDRPGLRELVAYAVPEPGVLGSGQAWRAELRDLLPPVMVPSAVVVLPRLPLTVNGKIDKAALPAPNHDVAEGRPPTTSAERIVCEQFGVVLGRAVGDVDADFLEVGGNSIRAVELAARLTDAGLPTDLSTVMHLRTPAALAKRLVPGMPPAAPAAPPLQAAPTAPPPPAVEAPTVPSRTAPIPEVPVTEARTLGQTSAANEPGAFASVLTLRAGDEQEPLFCVHGGFGLALPFAQLAPHVPPGRAVLGLQSPALELDAPLPDSIESVAMQYADTIQALQPHGPYHVIGWSYGGYVAHEVARVLEARGEQVATLGIVDAFPIEGNRRRIQLTTHRLMVGMLEYFKVPVPDHDDITIDEAVGLLLDTGRVPPGFDEPRVRRLVDIMLRHFQLAIRYIPGQVTAGAEVVVSTHERRGSRFVRRQGRRWARYVSGPIHSVGVAAKHDDLLDPGPAEQVALAMCPQPPVTSQAVVSEPTLPEQQSASARGLSLPPEPPSSAGGLGHRLAAFGSQVGALTGRRLKHVVAAPGRLVGILMNPLVMLIAVGYLFKDAVKLPPGTNDYLTFLIPGVLLQVGLASIGPTAITVSGDVGSGLMDRLRSMPIARPAVLVAHVLADTLVGIGALITVAAIGVGLGWRVNVSPAALASGFGLLLLFVTAMVVLGVVLGLVMKQPESIDSIGALILVVCSFLSSVVLSPSVLPDWIRPVSQWNPVSLVVDQVRRLWGIPVAQEYSTPVPTTVLLAALAAAVLGLLALATRRFAAGRRT